MKHSIVGQFAITIYSILNGNFEEHIDSNEFSQQKLSIFISSTFTDTHDERNILLESIIPKLQSRGIQHGVFVTFSDMRFGVKDENTLDHMTWIACAQEIKRCYKESGGIFFLSLQKLLNILNRWFLPITNSLPARYDLKNLKVIDDKDFWGRSVTEWETRLALRLDASRYHWMHRQFDTDVTILDDPSRLLFDAHDASTKTKLDDLITQMKSVFPKENITSLPPINVGSYVSNDSRHEELKNWERDHRQLWETSRK
eukprot:gene15167-32159_t